MPEGDWFCKTCVEAGKDKEKAAEDAKLAATTKAKPKPQPKTKKASRAAVSDAEEEDEDGGDDSGDDDADFAPSDDDDEPEKPSRRSSRGGVAKARMQHLVYSLRSSICVRGICIGGYSPHQTFSRARPAVHSQKISCEAQAWRCQGGQGEHQRRRGG